MVIGGFTEFAVASAAAAFGIPEEMQLPIAAAFFFPFHVAWVGLIDRADLRRGETVLIHAGAGRSGSAAIQLGKQVDAKVIATVGSPEKIEVCVFRRRRGN